MIGEEFGTALLASFSLVSLAEIGDKSQIVCMTLAARYHHSSVLLGAIVAFLSLNTLAVVFGASVAAWIPQSFIAVVVILLFGVFGLNALLSSATIEPIDIERKSTSGAFATTLALIFFAEFGDKTQIAVAGMSSSLEPLAVWIGASAALILLTVLGVWFGRTFLPRLPVRLLNQISGGLFLFFAGLTAWQAFG